MKAIMYNKYGTTEVLKLNEVEKPALQNNEVLIKVHAASVNSWDWELLRGKPFLARLGGLFKPKHNILGADIAGQVVAIGKEVKHLLPGDEVFGDISWCGWGGFAEYVCAHEDALSLKPASMTFEEAASIPQAAVLALQGLRDKGKIKEGQKVLINGAGGGVGTFALQIAKLYRADVTCVDRAEKLNMLLSMGADQVIDYTQEDFTQKGKSYELILDIVGYRSIFEINRILSLNGTYIMVGGSLYRILQCLLLAPLFSKIYGKKVSLLAYKPNRNDQNYLKELFMEGTVVPVIDKQHPLSKAADAVRYLGEGHAKGKVIIHVEHKNDPS